MKEKKPLYKRTWFIIVAVLLLLGGIGNALGGSSTDEPTASIEQEPAPSGESTLEESPTPEPTVSDSPLSDPNSVESIEYFQISTAGQVKDLNKDIDDAIGRAEADQTIRLLGNILELTFNLGQLRALDAPTDLVESWNAGLAKLESAIDVASDASTDFAADEATASQVVAALEKVRARVSALAKVAASAG